MLQKTAPARSGQGCFHPEDDIDLSLIDIDSLDQGTKEVAPTEPVKRLKSRFNPGAELIQAPNDKL